MKRQGAEGQITDQGGVQVAEPEVKPAGQRRAENADFHCNRLIVSVALQKQAHGGAGETYRLHGKSFLHAMTIPLIRFHKVFRQAISGKGKKQKGKRHIHIIMKIHDPEEKADNGARTDERKNSKEYPEEEIDLLHLRVCADIDRPELPLRNQARTMPSPRLTPDKEVLFLLRGIKTNTHHTSLNLRDRT
ncbi:MAG: hypothetical protein KJ649_04335 [Proteobacteria bacterium]|nr:hypothetical protein [Pseudomonadota bacterium]MBU1744108.1 hypothetical protein [Pseudomonadota bacterium]